MNAGVDCASHRSVVVRQMEASDVENICRLHQEAFAGFFLSTVGTPFLRLMYHWFLRQERLLCFVAEIKSAPVGFAVGSYKSVRPMKNLMGFVPFLLVHGPGVLVSLKPKAAVKVLKRLFERSDSGPVDVNSVCLRSIAVAPTARRTGAGSLLLRAFENSALHLKAAKVALTTDETNNGATLKFYEKNGYSVGHKFKQDGIRSMVQMVKYLAV